MSTTGERIRDLRLRNHLTLDDVARYLGVGRQAIYKYESGTVTNIPLDNLEKMAVLFGTTPGYLAGWTDDEPAENEPARTVEARIISECVDKMTTADREKALNILSAAFSDIFDNAKDKTS